MTTPDTQPPPTSEQPTPKPRRKRRTKAEIEAERAAKIAEEVNKPIDPQIWLILGGLLLFVGACIYFDPLSFINTGQTTSQAWVQIILTVIVSILGKNPTALILTILALLSLGWGALGWFRRRSDKNVG